MVWNNGSKNEPFFVNEREAIVEILTNVNLSKLFFGLQRRVITAYVVEGASLGEIRKRFKITRSLLDEILEICREKLIKYLVEARDNYEQRNDEGNYSPCGE